MNARALWDDKLDSNRAYQTVRSILLLAGAFTFAFLSGEMVHELGHYLFDLLWGVEVSIVLDPFGGSHIQALTPFPHMPLIIPTLAGPLANLFVGVAVSLLFWRRPSQAKLPVLLWGPSALMQEGVNLSAGMLSPGSDAALLAEWGIPSGLMLAAGLIFLAMGMVSVCSLFPLLNIAGEDSSLLKVVIMFGGMNAFLIARALYASLALAMPLAENMVAPIAGLLLAGLLAIMHRPLALFLGRYSHAQRSIPRVSDVLLALGLGTSICIFQLLFFN